MVQFGLVVDIFIGAAAAENVHFSLAGTKKMLDSNAAKLPRYPNPSLAVHIDDANLGILLIPFRRHGIKNEAKIALLPRLDRRG